nr:MAG TPA: hypothetical protein [Caudoviricetes sp.]
MNKYGQKYGQFFLKPTKKAQTFDKQRLELLH